ncbi:UpxY family transcription antiterminator [Flavisolibacter sp. BT320]|nr:UpxY family transcription antiterminator [Flavisolibacter longurius]
MNQNLRWHVVFTRQQCEKKVVLALTEKGYQCYCPQQDAVPAWKFQEKVVNKPLFSSYVFVRCTPEQFSDIKRTPGIINFMFRLDQPAVISIEEMALLKQAIRTHRSLQIIKTGWLSPSQSPIQESDSQVYPLHSIGVTLVGSKESMITTTPVVTEESKRIFPRFSTRFRLAWR